PRTGDCRANCRRCVKTSSGRLSTFLHSPQATLRSGGTMKSKPIIAGVDGSVESVTAAHVVWKLAMASGVPCQLVNAANDVNAALAFAGTGVVTETRQLAELS